VPVGDAIETQQLKFDNNGYVQMELLGPDATEDE
jgi:hypothetical protein